MPKRRKRLRINGVSSNEDIKDMTPSRNREYIGLEVEPKWMLKIAADGPPAHARGSVTALESTITLPSHDRKGVVGVSWYKSNVRRAISGRLKTLSTRCLPAFPKRAR